MILSWAGGPVKLCRVLEASRGAHQADGDPKVYRAFGVFQVSDRSTKDADLTLVLNWMLCLLFCRFLGQQINKRAGNSKKHHDFPVPCGIYDRQLPAVFGIVHLTLKAISN